MRRLKKASSTISSGSKLHTLARIFDSGLQAAFANGPPVGGNDIHGIARAGATPQAVDRSGKDPRMAAGKRTILAGKKNELGHAEYPAPGAMPERQ
jgi:hypothetical protein